MGESKLFRVTLLAAITLFMMEACPAFGETEKENIKSTIPSTWARGGKGPRGELSFVTSKDPTKGLRVWISSLGAPQQTAMEWADDEAKALASHGGVRIVTQPAEHRRGNSTWVGLAWEESMPVGGTPTLVRTEQYYIQGKQALVEIILAGPKNLFEGLNRREFDDFLSSVRFDTRSLEKAKRTAEAEYIAELETSTGKFAQPKKGEVVKGYIAVRRDAEAPVEGDLIGGMDMPVYTEVRTLIDGKTRWGGVAAPRTQLQGAHDRLCRASTR